MWDDPMDVLMLGLIVLVVGACIAIVAGAVVQAKRHQEFLVAHGCQQLTEAPTGRRVYCGKACWRDEKVYVYECADGTRTEVR